MSFLIFESANFFITEAGISDEETVVYPNDSKKKKSINIKNAKPKLDFELISASDDGTPKKKTTKKKSSKKK